MLLARKINMFNIKYALIIDNIKKEGYQITLKKLNDNPLPLSREI